MVVEAAYAFGLVVAFVVGVDDVAVPERVVGKDEAARANQREEGLVGFDVGALVAVEESQVEGQSESRGFLVGIADDERDAVGVGRIFDPRSSKILHFIVLFEGPQVGIAHVLGVLVSQAGQPFGHAQGRVAAERADLEDALGAYHRHEHLQQSSLQVAAGHVAMEGADIGVAPEPIEIVGLWRGMFAHVVFQGGGH